MHPPAPSSISSLDSASNDDASSSDGQFSNFLSSTPLSTAPQSSNTSVKSVSHASDTQEEKKRLKSSLKTSKSATNLAVRFSVPEPPPLPVMPGLKVAAPTAPCKNASPPPGYRSKQRASVDLPTRPPARMGVHKRLSAPAPISRRQSQNVTTPPLPPSPSNSRTNSTYWKPVSRPDRRVTSFQSSASAPGALQSTVPLSPSDPPSQYDLLQHYVPCLTPQCKNHYTTSLLGPTFYSPQSPYQLVRKRGLCPMHAQEDLKLANNRVKLTYESLRQNCGRKTLGAIAAEFELFVQQFREERIEESQRMKTWQRQRVLPSTSMSALAGKGKETVWEEDWDWRYSPRPCTKKGCDKSHYSPFDNRLYLFYTTPRSSGLLPLSTLCPPCAKRDVESAEEKIDSRMRDACGVVGPEWEAWCVQVGKDREMEIEFWEQAQERVVKESMVAAPIVAPRPEKTKMLKKKSSKRLTKLDVCVVM